jgi:hypothetical protein
MTCKCPRTAIAPVTHCFTKQWRTIGGHSWSHPTRLVPSEWFDQGSRRHVTKAWTIGKLVGPMLVDAPSPTTFFGQPLSLHKGRQNACQIGHIVHQHAYRRVIQLEHLGELPITTIAQSTWRPSASRLAGSRVTAREPQPIAVYRIQSTP